MSRPDELKKASNWHEVLENEVLKKYEEELRERQPLLIHPLLISALLWLVVGFIWYMAWIRE
jgi:hypothetical protein